MTAQARPRVLVLTHRVPHPPDKGDRIRTFHLIKYLAGRARVWLLALADEPVPAESAAVLARLCERVEIVPVGKRTRWLRAVGSAATGRSLSEGLFHEPAADAVLRRWVKEAGFAAAVVSASSLAPYLWRNGLDRFPGIADLMDVDSQKWRDFAAAGRGPKRLVYRFEAERVRKLEREIARRCAAVSLVSRAEADTFEAFAGRGTVTVATNGVDLEYFRPVPGPTDPVCVFVGAMDYLPNIDAAEWFARDVWPRIRTAFPAAEFRIVGRNPNDRVRALATIPGVRVVGGVPDVRPWVAAARVVVAPLRLGRGVQNKVIEAMAMAKPVVASPAALAALGAVVGRDVRRADDAEEWADAVGELLADPERGAAIGAAGRRYAEANHDWATCLEPLLEQIVPLEGRIPPVA
ncbi:MAG: TIGR03087 family PEP-CTERM/XrtA system glycosyltransferase, partial [Fimbriiglobus sp.]